MHEAFLSRQDDNFNMCEWKAPYNEVDEKTGIELWKEQFFQYVRALATGSATEPGHLLLSALTLSLSADARRLISRHPFVPAAQHLISSSDNSICGALEREVGGQPHKTPHFHPRRRHPPPVAALPGRAWVQLNRLRTSVAHKNKQSTMLSSNVHSIDLLMDCTAWRCWTIETIEWLLNTCPEI